MEALPPACVWPFILLPRRTQRTTFQGRDTLSYFTSVIVSWVQDRSRRTNNGPGKGKDTKTLLLFNHLPLAFSISCWYIQKWQRHRLQSMPYFVDLQNVCPWCCCAQGCFPRSQDTRNAPMLAILRSPLSYFKDMRSTVQWLLKALSTLIKIQQHDLAVCIQCSWKIRWQFQNFSENRMIYSGFQSWAICNYSN